MVISGFGQKPDTIKRSYMPTGLRVGTDLISLAKIPLSKEFDGWEVSGDLDFYRYYLTAEYGHQERTIISPSQNYSNSGNYFKIGADVNFLLKDPDKNMFFVGVRYGRSTFDEQLQFSTTDVVYGNSQQNLSNISMTSGWGEITLGLRVKVWKQLWMGYTARLKVAPSVGTNGEFIVYEIPGYGLASKRSYWGFNYQLYWRFPFRD